MENYFLRFPLGGRKIFNKLDNQDIIKSKEVSKSLNIFLEKDRSFWERVLQKYGKNHVTFKEAWISVIKNLPVKDIKELALAVDSFNTPYIQNTEFQYSPLHVVAKHGNVILFKQLAEKTSSINPKDKNGSTPFHYASEKGHLSICKFIIENSTDKNPKDNHGDTPLHRAADKGYFDICKLIIENVEDKNPAGYLGWTPLMMAAIEGHFDICKHIIENVEEKNPADNNGCTPLYFAAKHGHFEICKLIIENVEDKNPARNNAWSNTTVCCCPRGSL